MLAYWAANLLPAMMSRGRTPIAVDLAPNARTLTFALFVTILTILLFGLLPPPPARQDVQQRLKYSPYGGDRTKNRWARVMVATQVALLVLLLTPGRPVRADLAETAVD